MSDPINPPLPTVNSTWNTQISCLEKNSGSRTFLNNDLNISMMDLINALDQSSLGDPIAMYKNIIELHKTKSKASTAVQFMNELVITGNAIKVIWLTTKSPCEWLYHLYNMVVAITVYKLLREKDQDTTTITKQISVFWDGCVTSIPNYD